MFAAWRLQKAGGALRHNHHCKQLVLHIIGVISFRVRPLYCVYKFIEYLMTDRPPFLSYWRHTCPRIVTLTSDTEMDIYDSIDHRYHVTH